MQAVKKHLVVAGKIPGVPDGPRRGPEHVQVTVWKHSQTLCDLRQKGNNTQAGGRLGAMLHNGGFVVFIKEYSTVNSQKAPGNITPFKAEKLTASQAGEEENQHRDRDTGRRTGKAIVHNTARLIEREGGPGRFPNARNSQPLRGIPVTKAVFHAVQKQRIDHYPHLVHVRLRGRSAKFVVERLQLHGKYLPERYRLELRRNETGKKLQLMV